MLSVRASGERGHSQLDWLDSRHTFSFDQYYDAKHMSFGPLRVINEDWIGPGGGFGTHPHRDMEIITYVLEGQLQHKDSLGTGSVISSGEIQKMSAGTGILHSEFNASKEKPVHLLQIWSMPNKRSLVPSYEQERFELVPGEFKLLGAPNGDGLVSIEQDVRLFALSLKKSMTVTRSIDSSTKAWVQVARGSVMANGKELRAGDGCALSEVSSITFAAATNDPGELLLFEMA